MKNTRKIKTLFGAIIFLVISAIVQNLKSSTVSVVGKAKGVAGQNSVAITSSTAAEPNPGAQDNYYLVTKVVDGDTINVEVNGVVQKLRLIGIDTPEVVDPRKTVQCFGKEASNKAKELLLGKKVRLEADSTQNDKDKYGRYLRYIYREDGLFYNKWIIENGYAHEYTYVIPYKFQTDFKAAEKSARENGRGLWSPETCAGITS